MDVFEFLSDWWNEKGGYFVIGFFILFIFWRLLFHRRSLQTSFSDYLDKQTGLQRRAERGSQPEREARRLLEEMFQRPFPSRRPDFLKNPATGRNLECDMLNDELKLCVEYQGRQHTVHTPHFHTAGQFEDQQARDILKKRLLKENGYNLIEIPHTVKGKDLYPFLKVNLAHYPEYSGYYT